MDDPKNPLVFISHAQSDGEIAQALRQELEGIGVSTGAEELTGSKALLLLYSSAADESSDVQQHVATAVE